MSIEDASAYVCMFSPNGVDSYTKCTQLLSSLPKPFVESHPVFLLNVRGIKQHPADAAHGKLYSFWNLSIKRFSYFCIRKIGILFESSYFCEGDGMGITEAFLC